VIAHTLATLADRYAPWILAASLLVTALLTWAAAGLVLHTSLDKLLPEQAIEVRDVEEVNREVGGIGYVVAVVEGASRESVQSFTDRFVEALSILPNVRYVEHHYDPTFFEKRSLLLLDPKELQELDQAVQRRIDSAKLKANPLVVDLLTEDDAETAGDTDRSYPDGATPPKSAAEADEVPDLEALRARYADKVPTRERLISDDGRTAYILIKPTGLAGDLAFGQRFVPTVEALAKKLGAITDADLSSTSSSPGDGLRVGLTGNYVVRVQENQTILGDLKLASLLALLLSVGLVVLWTRRLRALLLVGFPLIAGVLWTGGLARLIWGEVNIVTGFLVAILFGLGIDFGIHLFMRFMEERRTGTDVVASLERAIAVTGRATLTGAVTTASAFFGLSIAKFEGFSQFGEVAALGVIVSFLATYLCAPPIYVLLDRLVPMVSTKRIKTERPSFDNRKPALLAGAMVLLMLGLSVFSSFSFDKIAFVTDFRKLQGELPATALYHRTAAALGQTLAPAVIMTRSLDEAYKSSEILHAIKQEQGETGPIGMILSLAEVVPPDQPARLKAIAHLRETLQSPILENASEKEKEELARALSYTEVEAFGIDALPTYAKNRFLGQEAKSFLTLVAPKEPPFKTKVLFAWADALNLLRERLGAAKVFIADENLIAAKIFRLMISDGPKVLLAAVFAVLLLLFLDLRSLWRAILVLTPLLLGVLNIAGFMRLLGVDLNFLNSVMIPSVIGIGIDNAVHVYHRYRDEGPGSIGRVLRHTGSAAFLASATTAIGFGTLVIAHHGGLRSVGELALIGMGSTFMGTTLFFPALLWGFEQLTQKQAQPAGPTGETPHDGSL